MPMLTKHMTVTASAVNFLRENSSGWRLPRSCSTCKSVTKIQRRKGETYAADDGDRVEEHSEDELEHWREVS